MSLSTRIVDFEQGYYKDSNGFKMGKIYICYEGDNRNHSTDSRVLGAFSEKDIAGVVLLNLSDYGITYYVYNVVRFALQLILLVIIIRREHRGREVLLDV